MSKKLISWGTPKQVQIREKKDPSHPTLPASKKHNAKHCKVLVDPHVFGAYFWKMRRISGNRLERFWPIGTCKGCGREERVWLGWKDNQEQYPAHLTQEDLQGFRL